MLWPRARRLDVIGQGGLAATLPYLEHLAGDWLQHGELSGTARWTQACAMAGVMVAGWPDARERCGPHGARMLVSLAALRQESGEL